MADTFDGMGRGGLLAALPALALILGGAAAAAQTAAGSAPGPLMAQTAATYSFDIPSGPLPQAIAAFSATTGLQALYTEPSTYAHQAPAVRGSLTAQQALDRLLAGSGLSASITPSGTVTLSGQAAAATGAISLPPVEIYGAKNAATLNDTLASVAVVSAPEIEQRQLGSFREAFRTMANVMDSDWADAGFVIRGVNSEGLTPGGSALASLYVDGAQQTVQGARRGARGLWDVEQVEVYRGPQSTLTGRAALAGAIYVKTKDPTFEKELKLQGTVGTMDTRGSAFAFGGPVIDNQVAYRIAGEFERSKNDVNYPTYERFDKYDEFIEDEYYNLRGKVLIVPDALPDSSALISYSFSHDSPYVKDIAGPGLGFAYGERRGDFNAPVFAETRSSDTQNASIELKHRLNSSLNLTALTAYSFSDTQRPSVNKGTAGETDVTRGTMEQSMLTQELRGNYASGAWAGVLGVYFASESDKGGYDRQSFGRADVSRSKSETWNAAVFGEATYEFLPSWKIVGGGRLDHTDRTNRSFFSRNGNVTVNQRTGFEETVFLPKIGVIKELTPDHTVGFTVQRGFRGGGAAIQTSTAREYTYNPEYAWNYELSYKGSFLANRLRTSANLFYMDWTDQQVEVRDDPADFASARTANAASSTSRGFELEGRFLIGGGFDTFASIGYVDTEFDEFSDASLGNISGMPFPEAPSWNVAFGAVYEHSSGFFVGADAKYLSDYLGRLDSAPHEYVKGYWLANAQIGYRMENLTLTLFAENLFDQDYFVYNARTATGVDVAATEGQGRVIGLTATLKF